MGNAESGTSPVKLVTRPFLFCGIGLILLGGLAMFAPQASGMAVGIVVGIFLVLSGAFRAALFWIAPTWGSALLRLVMGLLAIVAGIMMIADPAFGLQVITIVAVVYLVVDGITAFVFALRLPPGTGGIWMMISGVASVVLGVMIWRGWPVPADQAIGMLIGIKLMLDGIAHLAVAMAARTVGRAVAQA